MAKDKILSEEDFDNDYRKAGLDFPYEGNEYYHKTKVDGGFVASVAGIHEDEGLDHIQFKEDAIHGLAYVNASELPEIDENEGREPDEAIMKEGKKVTIKKATKIEKTGNAKDEDAEVIED